MGVVAGTAVFIGPAVVRTSATMTPEVSGGKWTEQGKPCPTCGERFFDKKKLRDHREKAHPVLCPVCGKGFATDDGVALHRASAHPE